MFKILAILLVVGIAIYWLICLVLQTEEEYREIEEGLEDEWL